MYRSGKWKEKAGAYAGILSLVIILGLIAFWETTGRNMITKQEIPVLKADVLRNKEIKEDMFTTIKINKDNLIDGVIINPQDVIGKEAKNFIPANAQLHPNYFDDAEVVTNSNQLITSIPKEWIYSVPDTLRRKDKAYFFEVNPEDIPRAIFEPVPVLNVEAPTDTMTTEDKDNSIDTYDPSVAVKLPTLSNEPILSTTVAFVKDGSNKEIVTVSKGDRIDANNRIASVEIVTTLQEFSVLREKALKGSKFIILYSENIDPKEVVKK